MFGKSDGEKSFSTWLTCFLKQRKLELKLGTHSIRKGAATTLASMTDGPSTLSLFLRAGWELGHTIKRYVVCTVTRTRKPVQRRRLKVLWSKVSPLSLSAAVPRCSSYIKEGTDHFTGRSCSLRDEFPNPEFSVLPPHFGPHFELPEGIEWGALLQDRGALRIEVRIMLLASLVHHQDFLEEHLPKSSPFWLSPVCDYVTIRIIICFVQNRLTRDEETAIGTTNSYAHI